MSAASPDRLYRDVKDAATGDWFSVAYDVLKATAKYIYVSGMPADLSGRSATGLVLPKATIRLSRQTLTREGYAFVPLMEVDDPVFFTSPIQERRGHYPTQRPACFERLDLPFPCKADRVRRAYRLKAKTVHPDAGGDRQEFLQLRADYEQALRLCEE